MKTYVTVTDNVREGDATMKMGGIMERILKDILDELEKEVAVSRKTPHF